MADQLDSNPVSMAAPPEGVIVWTPSDSLDVGHPTRTNQDGTVYKPRIVAITVLADSTLKVTMASGDAVTMFFPAGRTSGRFARVWSTGSTLGGSASTVACWY